MLFTRLVAFLLALQAASAFAQNAPNVSAPPGSVSSTPFTVADGSTTIISSKSNHSLLTIDARTPHGCYIGWSGATPSVGVGEWIISKEHFPEAPTGQISAFCTNGGVIFVTEGQ